MEKNLFYVIIRLPGLNSSNTSPSTSQNGFRLSSLKHTFASLFMNVHWDYGFRNTELKYVDNDDIVV